MPRAKQIELMKVRALLRLGQKIHQATDPASRKQLLLEALSTLVDASAAVSLVTRAQAETAEPMIVSTVRYPSATDGAVGRASHGPAGHVQTGHVQAAAETPHVRSAKHPIGHAAPSSSGRRRHTFDRPVQRPVVRMRSALHLGENVTANIEILRPGARFSAHDRKLVDLVHQELQWIYEHDVLLTSSVAATLSERQRETLALLLAGDSEKQIATKLKLSPNTVHHHVKRIYRHYAVNTRGELLARVFVASRS